MWFPYDISPREKNENQDALLYGDCVEFLLGVVLDVIIDISVGKPDGDKVGCWLGRIIGSLINTELGNCEGFSLYWSIGPIRVCALGGWCMLTGDRT